MPKTCGWCGGAIVGGSGAVEEIRYTADGTEVRTEVTLCIPCSTEDEPGCCAWFDGEASFASACTACKAGYG